MEDRDGCLLARVEGRWNPKAVERALDAIGAEARARGRTRVLLDMTHMAEPQWHFHRSAAGERAAIALAGCRVAAVASPGMINWIAHAAAARRGMQIFIASDTEHALRWLVKNPKPTTA